MGDCTWVSLYLEVRSVVSNAAVVRGVSCTVNIELNQLKREMKVVFSIRSIQLTVGLLRFDSLSHHMELNPDIQR